jgi:hypothetical protein
VKNRKLPQVLPLIKSVIQTGDSANGRNGRPHQTKQRNKDVKVHRQDSEAAEQAKTRTNGTPTWPAKSLEDVQDLLGIRWNCTPSLKRKLMEDRDALATTTSPKKHTKKSPGAKQDQMASMPVKTAGSTSSHPRPWPKKAKNVTPVNVSPAPLFAQSIG